MAFYGTSGSVTERLMVSSQPGLSQAQLSSSGAHAFGSPANSYQPLPGSTAASPFAEMSGKLEQLLTLVTNSQQVLIQQQAVTQQLQEQVKSLSHDVAELKSELAECQAHKHVQGAKKECRRTTVPPALSASILICVFYMYICSYSDTHMIACCTATMYARL